MDLCYVFLDGDIIPSMGLCHPLLRVTIVNN
jgi:hypothetical protein